MSIVEVAKAAGVTHGTVSRMINGRGGVSVATAARIRAAMVQLGYQPKPSGLRRGKKARPTGLRSGTVCLLLVGAPAAVLQRPGISTLVGTLEGELRRRGLAMLLAQAASLRDLPPCITQNKADGLMLIGEAADTLPAAFRHLPAVWLLSTHTRPSRWADHVLPDNEQIGILAAEYLSGRGYHQVAFYNEQPEHPGFTARGESFCKAARDRGLECTAWVAEKQSAEPVWSFGRSHATDALVQRLVQAATPASAIFVPTDEQTLRLYPALARHSIQPGYDVLIVSCDNQDAWLRQLQPRPMSIDLNFDLMGSRAVEQLLSRLAHPGHPPGTRILVPPRLSPSPSD
jgi:LacI family transcriptional regulator